MRKNIAVEKVVSIVVIAALVAGGFWYYRQHHNGKLPEWIAQSSGRLELNRIDVTSLYPGRVKAMPTEEGAEVKAGGALAELSSETSGSRSEEAQATETRQQEAVSRAGAAEAQMKQTVARAQANVAASKQQQRVTKMELDNTRKLFADQLVSQSEATKCQADYEHAAAAVKAAEAARDEAQATVAQSAAAQAEARAAVAQARAAVKSVSFANDDMNIRAPISDRVEYKIAEVGSAITSGSKVVSLLDPNDVSMNIFLPTGSMSRLKVNDDAYIRLDGIDAVSPAKIQFIATGAQFTPKAVETVDERAKLMFKVKLRIPRGTTAKCSRLFKGSMTGNGFVKTNGKAARPSELAVKLPQQLFRRPVQEEAV